MRVEQIGDATLYCADCREVLPTLSGVDAVVTDPPYGVGLRGKSCHSSARRNHDRFNSGISYASYLDGEDEFAEVVIPAIRTAITIAKCCAVFTAGTSVQKLPPFAALGGIYLPAGTGASSWGFQCFMHCVFYGKDPYFAERLGGRPNGKYGIYGNDANQTGHPCAKPIDAMMWAVERASLRHYTVADPFMGSGTTGVACARLGRKFIGIEIHEPYFDIACRRIEEAQRQHDLFVHAVPAPEDARMADLFATAD